MASDTVPAAPGPAHPDDPNTASAPGQPGAAARPGGSWLAAALQPVDPARPTFDLNPTTVLPGDPDDGNGDLTPTPGASSAGYHDGNPDQTDTTSGKNSSKERSVVRAWLLAGAERWRKGADTRNKRLDLKKARAQAYKEARTVTVNRAEKMAGGSTSTGGGSGSSGSKSLGSKTSRKDGGSGRGRSNGSGGGHHGAGGHSGSSGHGGGSGRSRHGSGGTGSGGGKGHGKTDHGKSNGKGGSGGSKNSSGSGGGTSGGGKTRKDGSVGPQGSSGTPNKAAKDRKTNNSSGSVGKDTKPQTTATCGDASGISMTKDKKPKNDRGTGKDTPAKADKTPGAKGAPGPAAGAGGNGGTTSPGKTPASGGGKPVDLNKKNPDGKGGDKPASKTPPDPAKTVDLTKKDPKAKADQTTKQKPAPAGPAIDTRSSRETGYRDGTRIGKAEAHVKAYTHGVRDGRGDIKEAAAREKARLDKAHQQHKQQPKATIPPKPAMPPVPPRPKEPPMPPASSADYHPTQTDTTTSGSATPVGVSTVTKTHVVLGTNRVLSRGEVRNLKDYERRLEQKTDLMRRMADTAKALQGHAEEQNKKVTGRLEQARGKKTGDELISAMVKLQEKTALQSLQAAELHKRAVRAADATTVLLANITTRYGGIYKAVCDSPLEIPGELDFYDDRTSHA